MNDVITNENFTIFAMKSYQNHNCLDIKEFYDDLKRVKYLKRLFNRYLKTKILKERLILNHIIVLYNVFGLDATKILFFKLDSKFWPALKTFLVYLNYMPDRIHNVSKTPMRSVDIPLDQNIIKILREI